MKTLLKNVALILDDKQSFSFLENDQNENEEQNITINTYVTLANFVLRDIAANFLCYIAEEKLFSDSGAQLHLSLLSHQPCTIKKVKNFFGKSVNFSVMVDCLIVPSTNEQYSVEYTYYPDELDLEDSLSLPLGLDMSTVCYGIVNEYYRLKMMFAEAEIWEDKYKKGLKILMKKYSDKFFLFCLL